MSHRLVKRFAGSSDSLFTDMALCGSYKLHVPSIHTDKHTTQAHALLHKNDSVPPATDQDQDSACSISKPHFKKNHGFTSGAPWWAITRDTCSPLAEHGQCQENWQHFVFRYRCTFFGLVRDLHQEPSMCESPFCSVLWRRNRTTVISPFWQFFCAAPTNNKTNLQQRGNVN